MGQQQTVTVAFTARQADELIAACALADCELEDGLVDDAARRRAVLHRAWAKLAAAGPPAS